MMVVMILLLPNMLRSSAESPLNPLMLPARSRAGRFRFDAPSTPDTETC